MQELRTTTKVTAQALGQTMPTLVVQEPALSGCGIPTKCIFSMPPISQSGLFGDHVKDFAQQFLAVQKQIACPIACSPGCR